MIFQIYHDEWIDSNTQTFNFSWLVNTTRCLIVTVVTIGLLYIALVLCQDLLVTIRFITLNLLGAIIYRSLRFGKLSIRSLRFSAMPYMKSGIT
jgi:hypothetical protein